MKGTVINKVVNSTQDCVSLLAEVFNSTGWKRKAKIKSGCGDARTFVNGSQYVTLVSDISETRIFSDVNLQDLTNLIKEIKTACKNYYTYDCGEVYLNPYTLELWIVGGDGGFYHSTSKNTLVKFLEKGGEEPIFKNFTEYVPDLSEVNIEAEDYPDDNFIEICSINLLGED